MFRKTWNTSFLIILTIVSVIWLAWGVTGLLGFKPQYHEHVEKGQSLPPLARRLVFVIVDGLRYDVAEKMSCVQKLKQASASARSISALPSVSQPTWTTLVSGARPEINGAALFNAPTEEIQPIQVEHLFQVAHDAGLTTALAGCDWWQKMVPAQYLDRSFFAKGFYTEDDRQATQAAIGFIQDPGIDFILLYLGSFDTLADQYGTFSPQAQQAAQDIDAELCTLLSSIDLSNTVLVMASDHGQMTVGGHGGDDPPVIATLALMAGPRVRPGEYPSIQQPDLAVTIAALLGTRLPSSNQGHILYSFLDVSPAEKARGQVALAEQRAEQADAYLWSIKAQSLPSELRAQASALDALLKQEKFEEADLLAAGMLARTEGAVARARAARINGSRLVRAPLALIGLLLVAVTLALNWRAGQELAVLALLPAFVGYHAFWLLRGHVYSLSTLGIAKGIPYIALSLVGGALVAVALGFVALGIASLVRRKPRVTQSVLDFGVAFSVGLAGLFFVQALLAFVGDGGLGHWSVVVPALLFIWLFSLIQTALVGLVSLATIGISMLAGRFRGRLGGVQKTGSKAN